MSRAMKGKNLIKRYFPLYASGVGIYALPLVLMSILCMLGQNGYSVSLGIKALHEEESVDYFSFGQWGAMMALPIILNGFYLNTLKKIKVFVRIRLNGRMEYRILQLFGCIMNALLWSGVIILIARITVGKISFASVGVILSNQLLWGISYMFVNNFMHLSSELSGVVVMAGISTLHFLGEYRVLPLHASPTAWGMVYRSAEYTHSGISAKFMIMGNVIVGALLMIILMSRPIDLEE